MNLTLCIHKLVFCQNSARLLCKFLELFLCITVSSVKLAWNFQLFLLLNAVKSHRLGSSYLAKVWKLTAGRKREQWKDLPFLFSKSYLVAWRGEKKTHIQCNHGWSLSVILKIYLMMNEERKVFMFSRCPHYLSHHIILFLLLYHLLTLLLITSFIMFLVIFNKHWICK